MSSNFLIKFQSIVSIAASEAYEKLCLALNKSTLTKAIEKASSVEQTSCLEGYHSVVNQFAPKMLGPVVQRLDNAIHRINHYPADRVVCFVNTYPLDSDLSGG